MQDDGWYPQTGLVVGPDGSFYGTTYGGGANGYGTVFKMTLVAAPTVAGFSPAARLPGTSVTITGTNLANATSVTFGGVAATGIFSDSATQVVAIVPSGAVTGPVAVTTAGGTATSASSFTVAALLHTFAARLVMLSAPVDDSGLTPDQQFDQTGVTLAVWDPDSNAYVVSPVLPADTIRPGQGYWARFASSTDLLGVGSMVAVSESSSVSLVTGWNMIGVPRPNTVSVADLTLSYAGQSYTFAAAAEAGLIVNSLFTYQAGDTTYESMTGSTATLQPYYGYWLYAYHRCTLVFSGEADPRASLKKGRKASVARH